MTGTAQDKADDALSGALDRMTNKIAELEQQVRDLSAENSQLRGPGRHEQPVPPIDHDGTGGQCSGHRW